MPEQSEGRPGGGSGGSPFTRKLGPLPLWAWMGIGLAGALAYSSWRKNKAAAATTTTAATGTSLANQTPPFIIQNYTSPGAQGPAGPPGTSAPAQAAPIQSGPAINPAPPGASPPAFITPAGGPAPTVRQPQQYRVQPGDTLTGIATKFHVPGGWQQLYQYNTGTGPGTANRPASTIATLRQRGPNLLYPNELIYVP